MPKSKKKKENMDSLQLLMTSHWPRKQTGKRRGRLPLKQTSLLRVQKIQISPAVPTN